MNDQDYVTRAPHKCCRMPGNVPVIIGHPDARPDLVVRICRICEARHFELSLDPGYLGIVGVGI